ncbi:MAG: lipopolysaccharide kinase InaA family protein [Planctomycetota bacterium]
MKTTKIIFNGRTEGLFRGAGLSTAEDFLRSPMERVTARSIEWTTGDLTPAGMSATFVLKTFFPVRPWRMGGRDRCPCLREYANLLYLLEAGVGVPEPAVAGHEVEDGRLVGSFLVTEKLYDASPWPVPFRSRTERLDALRVLGLTIKRMHEARFHHGDALFCNILWRVPQTRDGPSCFITNCPRGKSIRRDLSEGERADDLGALLVDAGRALTRTECLRILLHYRGEGGLDAAFAKKALAARRARILRRARVFLRADALPGMPMSFQAPPDTLVSFDDAILHELNVRKLADFETLRRPPGREVVSGRRPVYRLEGRPGKEDLFVKVIGAHALKEKLAAFLPTLASRTRALNEWFALHAALGAGLRVPRPLGIVQRRSREAPIESILVTAALPERARRLDLFLDSLGDGRGADLASLWRAIAVAVGRLHAAGLVHNELFAKHIFVSAAPDARPPFRWEVHFLDLQNARVRRATALRARARDLAALRASVPPFILPTTGWNEFLRSYVASCPPDVRYPALRRAVGSAQRKLGANRRVTRMLYEWADPATAGPQARLPLRESIIQVSESLRERLLVHADYAQALADAGLATTLDFLYCEGSAIRAKESRSISRLTLKTGERSVPLYLKRHEGQTLGQVLAELLRTGRIESPGLHEAANIQLLRSRGIAAPIVVAAGEELKPFWTRRSFLLTAALEGARPLDDFFREKSAQAPRLKTKIIDHLARLARHLHASGFHHQDFYLNHVFIRPDEKPELILIDLQRMYRRRRLRRRWIIKDLGQLNYSADRAELSRADRLRFFKTYLNASYLSRADKRFLTRILRKTSRIIHHTGFGQ